LHKLVHSLKKDGKVIAGFGAPTKATKLMTHFGLDDKVLDFIVDDNPLKQGLYTPITKIPVLSTEALYERKPDYVLILAWNFVAAYETLSETHWNAPHIEPNFTPNWVIDISNSINKKIEDLKCYVSQISDFPGPRSIESVEAIS
jgi:hypothetical protein